MCSVAEAEAIAPKFGERMAKIEGGPRAMAQTVESVKLCASLKVRQEQAGLRLP